MSKNDPGSSVDLHDVEVGPGPGELRFTVTILPPTPTQEAIIQATANALADAMRLNFVMAVVGFHAERGRWPRYAWYRDLRPTLDADPVKIAPPEVHVGDERPGDVGGRVTVYETGILNQEPKRAASFLAEAADLVAKSDRGS